MDYTIGNKVYSDGQQMSGDDTSNNSAFTGVLSDGTSFTGTYSFPNKKYYDSYSYGSSNESGGKLGDTTIEMAPSGAYSYWYRQTVYFVSSSTPWFAHYQTFDYDSYHGGSGYSTHAVISILD